jgi:uncharacterized integral membrane protein
VSVPAHAGWDVPTGVAKLPRKIVTAIIVIPLAVVIIAFAIANRQMVTVSFDPFSVTEPAAVVTLPLFALIVLLLIIGVLIGGAAAWLRQSRWRSTARRLEREVADLRAKVDALGGPAGEPTMVQNAGSPPQRLKLRPPVP